MKLNEIINLKSTGALASIFLLLCCPETFNPALKSLIYICCIAYCLWYGYSAYCECNDPVTQAKQAELIKSFDEKIKGAFRRKT